MTASKYSADLVFRLDGHASADIEVNGYSCDPKWRTVRQRGHWIRLRNRKHKHISLIGPITEPPQWDFETDQMLIRAQDWMIEPLEQVMLRRFAFTGNLVEAALALMAESGIEQPTGNYRVESYLTEDLFPIVSTPPREVQEWWSSLTLAGLRWTVIGEVLQLGINENNSFRMRPSDWEDDGIQLTHGDFANLIVFEGDDDLLVVYPETDFVTAGFYPRVPLVVRDAKVSDFVTAELIARRLHARLSNPALIVQGVNQVNVPLTQSMPATQIDLLVKMPKVNGDLVRTSQASTIEETEITIVDGIETSRTIRVQPTETAVELGPV